MSAGDRHETRAFVLALQKPVFALLGRTFPHDMAVVEDLAQEAFAKALRALDAFDPEGPASLKGWMLTIAARVAIDELRRRQRKPAPEPLGDPPAATTSPDVETAVGVTLDLGDAITRLPPEARLVVTLRMLHGLSERDEPTSLRPALPTA